MSDSIKIVMTVENMEIVQSGLDRIDKAVKDLRGSIWELSRLKTSTKYERTDLEALKSGDLTVNQIREKEGLAPIDDPAADMHLVSADQEDYSKPFRSDLCEALSKQIGLLAKWNLAHENTNGPDAEQIRNNVETMIKVAWVVNLFSGQKVSHE